MDNSLFSATKQSKALRQALRATLKDEECSGLVDEKSELSITRISEKHLLVSTPCWLAAYNSGDGYWVIHDAAPYQPVLVTMAGSDFDNGSISVAQKGRGLGDCLSFESLTWDGKRFVQTQISTTGMCKSITPGGAWSLPTLTTEVRPSAR